MGSKLLNIEKLKAFTWAMMYFPKFRFHYWKSHKIRESLKILPSLNTIDYILKSGCSVSRFGDGELQMLSHYLNNGTMESFDVDTFQDYDPRLALRLKEVFQNASPNILTCLPYQFKQSQVSKLKERVFWEREWRGRYRDLQELGINKRFGDTNFTRFYMGRRDIDNYPQYISKMKEIWEGRPIVIVEGEFSRLGVENDFFDNAKSIERIICPARNAFEKYDKILLTIKELNKEKLILIALGHTATILAYDLGVAGFQAIDVGHIDIEYEWYRSQTKEKIPVQNKYVNEVHSGRIATSYTSEIYGKQILNRIN